MSKEQILARLKNDLQKNLSTLINDEILKIKRLNDISSILVRHHILLNDSDFHKLTFKTDDFLNKKLSHRQIRTILKETSIPYWMRDTLSVNEKFRNLSKPAQEDLNPFIRNCLDFFGNTLLDTLLNKPEYQVISDDEITDLYRKTLLNNLPELQRLAIAQMTQLSGEAQDNLPKNLEGEMAIASLLCKIEQLESDSSEFNFDCKKNFEKYLEKVREIKDLSSSCSNKTFLFFRKSAKAEFLDKVITTIPNDFSSYQRRALYEYAATLPLSISGSKNHNTETAKTFRLLAVKCTDPQVSGDVLYRGRALQLQRRN